MTEEDLTGDSGVLKRIITPGQGDETPSDGCTVSIHYTGKLADGLEELDSSWQRDEPFEFVLGKGIVIKAFDIGVATMKKGEKCELICAPQYACGSLKIGSQVPPNSTLIVTIELLDWKGEDISPNSDGSIQRYILEKSTKRRSPEYGAQVQVHLVGKHEGRIFEERDVNFNVGEGSDCGIVEGVEIALLKIYVGETSRLIINSKYAFGTEGNVSFNIPPHASVEYIVTLNKCEKATAPWKTDKDESLVQAKLFKEKGNNYLKSEKYQLAIKMYNKSDDFLSNCDNDESQQVKVAIHLNKALCNQKLCDYFEAKNSCNSALAIDPNNIKGLYRRGQCYLQTNDFHKALEDFQKVHELDPKNKAAINQITIAKQKIKEFHDQEKKVYANMFSKFAAADKQKENTNRDDEPDVLSFCGEWTEEEALKQADKAFERDNNIVMLNPVHPK